MRDRHKRDKPLCWEKTRDGKLTDKPDHEFSHGMDAMRYGVQKAIMPDAFSFN
jgi:phage terminase large subunit